MLSMKHSQLVLLLTTRMLSISCLVNTTRSYILPSRVGTRDSVKTASSIISKTGTVRMMADDSKTEVDSTASNVLGTPLQCCCADVGGSGVGTGFYRNGFCSTGEQDRGRHTVCAKVTDEFLEFSKSVGNDLSTPAPMYSFPGLKEGDIWCLCAQRWVQAYHAGKAPKIYLQATHEKTLDYVTYDILREYALDADDADKRLKDLNEQRSKLNKLL